MAIRERRSKEWGDRVWELGVLGALGLGLGVFGFSGAFGSWCALAGGPATYTSVQDIHTEGSRTCQPKPNPYFPLSPFRTPEKHP